MTDRMGKAQKKTIMSIIIVSAPIRSAHAKSETISCKNKWNVV
jgi:hypothetical protein